jgi:hypothetical protein
VKTALNLSLKQTVAVVLDSRVSLSHSAAAAAELLLHAGLLSGGECRPGLVIWSVQAMPPFGPFEGELMSRTFAFAGLAVWCLASWAPAVAGGEKDTLKDQVRRAMKRGVAYLKQLQAADGTWSYLENVTTLLHDDSRKVGPTALAGLTLLECGVPAKDRGVQKAADYVRKGSVDLTGTYGLSLAILFLDRLGDPTDVPLIESMTVRLLAGQNPQGGWSYYCPEIAKEEKDRLTKHLAEREELIKKGKAPARKQAKVRTVRDLPREILDQLVLINRQQLTGGLPKKELTPGGDNSNTQFATLALWVGRRQGLPVLEALKRSGQRFRLSQHANGGWAYSLTQVRMRNLNLTTATMTCAGLLGLALDHGAAHDRAKEKGGRVKATDPDKDAAVKRGLAALATTIGQTFEKNEDRRGHKVQTAGRAYYYFWSLERVAMAYGLDKIGTKDWYRWGAEFLVDNQNANGSWKGDYGEGGVDTCFALLFLRRSNLVPDLTACLKGRIKNPGVVALKSGGSGGEKLLLGKGMEPGITNKKRPDQEKGNNIPREKPRVIQVSQKDQDREIARLTAQLVRAPAEEQPEVVAKLKGGKGVVFTEALAGAIPLLKGGIKARARAALAERLTRMSAGTLRDKLKDENLEIRRAAALACARKKAKAHVPDLIALLEDPELPVALAAHQALKELTGKDFGPEPDASRAERKAAVAEWKAWWKKSKSD